MINRVYKTLDSSDIYSPISPPSPPCISILLSNVVRLKKNKETKTICHHLRYAYLKNPCMQVTGCMFVSLYQRISLSD